MLAPFGPRTSNNGRGRGPSRASLRSRGTRNGVGTGQTAQGPTAQGTRDEARGPRRTSPAAITRGGRQPSPATTRGNEFQPQLKRPPNQSNIRNKTWRNPASLNVAFQSHAGKVTNSRNASWRNPPFADLPLYHKQMNDLYQMLKQSRERERKQAIKDGFLADPDKPTTLANAITPVGICQDMCPEFERVERIVQLMVDGREKVVAEGVKVATYQTADASIQIFPAAKAKEKVAYEDIMVKRFRRSAAGYDEQLPSDIRPPTVLQKTLDYLFNDVVGGPEPLATVHKFVWDRTRSVRNDFSIQQVTKVEDLMVAIDCFERIARFHILSLHQLSGAGADTDSSEFDPYQEREQLNNTLLSLQYYYDDSRHKLSSPNEAEFRAYGIIFEIQDQRPDIEDRLQSLPKDVLKDRRIQTALKLHAAAGNISDEQGPLRPRTQFLIAQANSGGFWSLVQSNAVSYLMACVAEVYFNLVRRTALEAIWKAYKGKRLGPTKMEDWTLKDLTKALGFDNEAQTRIFCEQHEFAIGEKGNREHYIDLGSVAGGVLTDQNPRRKQIFSRMLVESKRLGRTLPAVVNGLSASQAQAQGFVEDVSDADADSTENSESLFVDGDSDNERLKSRPKSASPINKDGLNNDENKLNPTATPFTPSKSQNPLFSSGSNPFQTTTFGKPSINPLTTTAQAKSLPPSKLSFITAAQPSSVPVGDNDPPQFGFFGFQNTNQAEEVIGKATAIGSNEPSKLDLPTAAKTSQLPDFNSSKNSPFVNPPGAKPSVFGQQLNTAPVPLVDPNIVSNQPPTTTVSAPSLPRGIFDKPSGSSAPPTFSFGTSPLFQTVADPTSSKDPDASSSKPNDKSSKSSSTADRPISSMASPAFFAPPKAIINPIVPHSGESTKPSPIDIFNNLDSPSPPTSKPSETSQTKTTSLFANPNSGGLFQPKPSTFPSSPQQSLANPKPNAEESFLPNVATTVPRAANHPAINQNSPSASFQGNRDFQSSSNISSLDSAAQNFPPSLPTRKDDQPSSRPIPLDRLSDAMMLEDNGLLQKFIEFTVEPIIKSSLAQLVDEDSWEEARKYRIILLSRKYFKRWRATAWSMGLIRKGKDRRRNFAQAIQDFAKSNQRKQNTSRALLRSSWTGTESSASGRESPVTKILPPPTQPQGSQSIAAASSYESIVSELPKGPKRKRDDTSADEPHKTPRPTQIGHRRSQTLGNTVMSAPPHRLSHKPYKSRLDVSQVAEGSMLNDVLMKQARRLAPTAKSDTTRTDYFRLKALGIDPDTPIVPQAKKRTRAQTETNGNGKIKASQMDPAPTLRPAVSGSTAQLSSVPAKAPTAAAANGDHDDEALFAQIRSVREALAESEQWFQSERRSIEHSMTPQPVIGSPPNPPPVSESPAQRKVREIKERGPTSSRTEIRLRAMGDKALLPKGFWDGEGMGLSLHGPKSKQNRVAAPNHSGGQRPNGMMGFAALTHANGRSVEGAQRPNGEESKAGASVEDAIEL